MLERASSCSDKCLRSLGAGNLWLFSALLTMGFIMGPIWLSNGCLLTDHHRICTGLTQTQVSEHVVRNIQCSTAGNECAFQAGINTTDQCVYWFNYYNYNASTVTNLTSLSNVTDWLHYPLYSSLWMKRDLFGQCWPRILPNSYDARNIILGFVFLCVGLCGICIFCAMCQLAFRFNRFKEENL